MKKTLALTLCVLLFAFCIIISGADAVHAEASFATEATDVYWYVHGDKLLLSSAQGNSGYYKWSKESIASVINAADVPWNSSRGNIKSVIIYEPIAPPSTAFWFQDTNLTSFSATTNGTLYLDMSFTTDASRMFAGCSELTELDLSGVSAPLVKNIESAFDGCSSITSLDISCFDGAPITNMMNAFYGCSGLKSLDISCFEGAPIADMLNAFSGCSQLKTLDVSVLDISRVTDFSGVFSGCSSLQSLDLSSLDGRKITTLEDSFNGCESLTSLIFGDKITCENVTNMKNTFKKCKLLTSLDISGFSTSKVTDMSGCFAYCEALPEITFGSGFVCSAVTDMESTFASCKAFKSLDTSGFAAGGVKNMKRLFSDCTSLETLDLSGFDGAKPTDISEMFSGTAMLKSIDLSGLDTSGVTDLTELFAYCASLEYFDLSSIDTAAVTKMDSLFKSCTSLTSFTFNGVNTSLVETLDSMFYGCSNLTSVDLSGLDSTKITDIDSMFNSCSSLRRLDLSNLYITEGLDPLFLVRGCTRLEMIDAPDSIPASASISLSPYEFYTGEAEITELTSENQGNTVVRKFDIKYFWKNGTQVKTYTFEPSYYYYGYGTTVEASVSENGYVFGGWTRKDSDVTVTEITETDSGEFLLYATMTAYQPVAPTISVSDDVIVTYGEGFDVNISFTEDEFHTYWIEWYRTTARLSTGGMQVSDLRNTRGFTADPRRFVHGIKIEEEAYFYCTVKATRKDNGLSKTVSSPAIKVYVQRAQAVITVHPEAINGLVYDGSAQAVSTDGVSSLGEVVYSLYESEGYTRANNKQTKAGVGILYYRVPESTNYKGTEVYSLEYRIEAATPDILWNAESQTLDYTGEEAVIDPPSVVLLNSDIYSGAVSYSYTGTSSGTGLPVDAGTYSVIASIAAHGNYKEASSEALTLVINKVEPEFDKEPTAIDGLIYSGAEQALVNGGEALGGTVEFSLDESSWSIELPKGKNAGEYTVYYRIKGDNNHLDGASGSLSASIGKKNITVAAVDKLICVSSDYTLTYEVFGLADGEDLPIAVTLSTDASIGTVGDYGITVSGAAESDNYVITYAAGTLTVRDHAYDGGAVTSAPTCAEVGEKTYTCTHDSAHIYTEPIPIDENAHSWNEGVITKQPTCTEKGEKTYTCTHSSAHTYTEDIDATGHNYDNDCDADCNVCGEARTPAEHSDINEDHSCDTCGAELPGGGLSAGAIVGIVLGSVAVIGIGGFSIFWLVFKKKK